MTTKRSILTIAFLGIATALGACESSPKVATSPASFETPANWLDRVSVVAWMPKPAESSPVLGDYENEPTRFFFQGVPLSSRDDDDSGAAEEGGLPEGIISTQSFAGPGGG